MGFMWTSLDESADKERKHVFVVAGYLARQRDWTEIERQWVLRLEKDSIKYFSSSECMRLMGEFARFRNQDKYPKPSGRKAADKIRDDLQEIMKKTKAPGLALGLLLKNYRAMWKNARARKILRRDPYEHMYTMMMIVIAGELEDEFLKGEWPVRETVAYLCDEHDKSANIKAVYDELKRQNPICAQWMGSLSYMDNKESPALQAADLLASRCKDALVQEFAKGQDHQSVVEEFRNQVGKHVLVRHFDKKSLHNLVEGNLLKDGKPSIYSTQQLVLAKDFLLDNADNQ